MHPDKVRRDRLRTLTDLPNIGPSMAADLKLLGIHRPDELRGQCPYEMYERLCRLTQTQQDPCVLDVFLSITDFMAGNPPRVWWEFTDERKQSQRI
ncbi:MAG: helix-hairpin-helix domain-containing protein [bacterium]|nr:helix-hairpin-helix domain-containing protein [bacterium]